MHGQKEGDRKEPAKRKMEKIKHEDRCGKRTQGNETGKRWLKPSVQAHRCASLRMCMQECSHVSTRCASVWHASTCMCVEGEGERIRVHLGACVWECFHEGGKLVSPDVGKNGRPIKHLPDAEAKFTDTGSF